MINMHTFHPTLTPGLFLRRWHRQHGWRMRYQSTGRMQSNPFRWAAIRRRTRREMLLAWAHIERDGYAACIEHRNRLPSNDDAPRSAVYWHTANLYARVALGEELASVLADEAAQLTRRIQAYNANQEKIPHTWHGGAGYYSEDEVRTKMQHARQRIQRLGY